jgi:hypothetical protein
MILSSPRFQTLSTLLKREDDSAKILSSYEGSIQYIPFISDFSLMYSSDAARTYQFTWAIRLAAEKSRKAESTKTV